MKVRKSLRTVYVSIGILLGTILVAQNLVLSAPQKHALVIGNDAYEDVPLKSPAHDANAMAILLEQLGFSVIKKVNINQQEMEDAIREFGQQLNQNTTALFYFSGHGVQVNGVNYLLPVGETIRAADEIKYKAVAADMVLSKLDSAKSRLNIVILDACRNNPFKGFRSPGQGLAEMSAPTGTIVAYATAPGSVAYDGLGENSPYTAYLLEKMQEPGLGIERMFKAVRIAVMNGTDGQQIPWESSSLIGDFYFVAPSDSITSKRSIPSSATKLLTDSQQRSQMESSFSSQDNTIAAPITLWLNKKCGATYVTDEKVVIKFKTTLDGYVTVYDIMQNAEPFALFPNRETTDNSVKKGITYSIPESSSNYDLIIEGEGTEYVIAVISSDPSYHFRYSKGVPNVLNRNNKCSSSDCFTAECYFIIQEK